MGSEVRVLNTMDWTLPVRVWCIEYEKKVAPQATNRSIAEIMTRNGYERRAWAHEADGDRTLEQNQLWVWRGEWAPQSYRWRPWADPRVNASAAPGGGPGRGRHTR